MPELSKSDLNKLKRWKSGRKKGKRREKSIDRAVVRWFKQTFPKPIGVYIKLAQAGKYGSSGWPDRLFIAGSTCAFIEMKATGERPTDLQKERMKQLEEAGQCVAWFDNDKAAIEWLKEVFL